MRKTNCFICEHWTTERVEIPIKNGTAWTNESRCNKKKSLFKKICDEFKEQIYKEVEKV